MKKTLALSGTPSNVAVTLLALAAASRISRLSATEDGETVTVDLIPDVKVDAAAIEYSLDDHNEPTTSIVIAIPGQQDKYLIVEDVRMSELAAKAIASVATELYSDGLVATANVAEIYAPTPLAHNDRTVVRAKDGQKIADINLDDIAGNNRITAATAYDANQENPVITLAAIGSPKVYALDPESFQAKLAMELDANIVRASRNDDGSVSYQLSDGSTAKINSDVNGALQLTELTSAPTDEVPADYQGWQAVGFTSAVLDVDGQPTKAEVQPTDSGINLRFTRQALPAQEAGAQV